MEDKQTEIKIVSLPKGVHDFLIKNGFKCSERNVHYFYREVNDDGSCMCMIIYDPLYKQFDLKIEAYEKCDFEEIIKAICVYKRVLKCLIEKGLIEDESE